VIAQVRSRKRDTTSAELQALRDRIKRRPEDLDARVRAARLAVDEYRRLSDPRLLGQAEALLGEEWKRAQPPDDVLLLRATIRQSLHRFDPALGDLDLLLANQPDNAQARFTRALVLSVRGRLDDARTECERLRPLTRRLVHAACSANVESLNGHAGEAYAALDAVLARGTDEANATLSYAYSVLGEAAERAGRADDAEAAFRRALEFDVGGSYSQGALADFYLDANRPADALAVLAGRDVVDGLLLRLAIAARRTKDPKAQAYRDELGRRISAAQNRGDTVHLREEARFALEVEDRAAYALEVAKRNFAVQQEPWDVRLLLAAALKGGTLPSDDARAALDFVRRTHLEGPVIVGLVERIRGGQR
jgi:predicted Zn-dependent protease